MVNNVYRHAHPSHPSRLAYLVEVNVVSLQPLEALLHSIEYVVPRQAVPIGIILDHGTPNLQCTHREAYNQPFSDTLHLTLVAKTSLERSSGCLTSQFPIMASDRPSWYTSAVSMKFPPA